MVTGNTATAVTLSGDATLDNAGALAIGAGKITAPMLSTGGVNAATSGVIIAGATGNLVNFACSTSGHVLKWSVTGWSCAFPDPSIPTLANGKIWVGNAGNAATEVTLSGDVSIDTAGVANLATTGVTAGTFTKVGVDAKGRVISSSNLASADVTNALTYTPLNKAGDTMVGALAMGANDLTNAGNISMAANKYFGLSANSTNGTVAGQMWYDGGTIKYYDGSTTKSLGVAGAGITNLNGLTSGTQSFAIGTSGNSPGFVSATSTHTLNIPMASTAAVTAGLISKTDYDTFNAKQSSTLADAKVWVGNSGNAATEVSISGDASIANTGVLTLATSGVTAGTYSKVTVDAKGRVTVGSAMASSDITAALGFTPVNKAGDVMVGNLSLASVTSDPAGLVAGDEGKMWYRSDLNTIRYWDGATAVSLGVAGSGINSLNGLTTSTQSFVLGTAGTDILFTSIGSAHTLDIPTASATKRGALSSADWTIFNAKQGSTLNSAQIWVGNSGNAATAVTLSGDATLDNAGALAIGAGKITAPMLSTGGVNAASSGVIIAGASGNLVNFACSTSGHVLKWSVTGWSCAFPDPSIPTLASGEIFVGNAGNAATEVTLSGDVSIDTAGVANLATTGVTAGTFTKVGVDAKGRVIASASLVASDVTSALTYTPLNKAGDTMVGALAMGANDLTNAGNISMAANKYFGLSANSTNGTVAGQMWYDGGTIKYYDGSTTKSLGVAGAGITNLNGLTSGTQSFTTGSAGADFGIASAGSQHTFNLPTASASNRGALSSADWSTFNNKMSNSLSSGSFWVGNSGNAATPITMSGDATMSNAGVLTLATSGVTAGTYSKVTVDGKGRVTVGSSIASSDITAALGFTPVNKAGDVMLGNLSLASVTSDPAGLVAGDEGKMWYRSDLNTIRYWDGTTAVSLGVAGSGINNLNGLTTSTQSFVLGTAGNYPAFSSAGSAHTLNIPMASTAAVTAGLISKADYDAFNAKQGSTLNSAQIWVGNSGNAATAVTLSGDATINTSGTLAIGAGKITAPMLSTGGVNAASSGVIIAGASGNLVNFACSTSGHVLKWSVTGWSCAFPDPSIPTLASGKIWVGNAGNAATEVTLSGDVSIDTAGVANLATTGVTAGTFTKVGVDAKGRVISSSNLASADITNALGFSPASGTISFVNNGNSFGSNAVLGTNDSFELRFKTNGTQRMAIDTTGNVGIGTMAPGAALHVFGNSSPSFIAESSLGQSIIELKTNTTNADIYLNSATSNLGFGATDYSAITGTNNTLIGIGSGDSLSSGINNTTLGKSAMTSATTGNYNTAIGLESMSNLISGSYNTAIGHQNAANVTTGANNTFIGARAGFYANGASSNNIFIGYNSGPSSNILVNNQLWIGNSSNPLIFGDFSAKTVGIGNGSSPPNSTLDINGALTQRGITTPSVAPAGQGVIYFDSTANKFKVSQNSSAYVDLIGGGSVTGVAASAPLSSSGGSTPNISITQATNSTDGYLSSTDWNAFNNKLASNLLSGKIWVGNSSNIATPVNMTGDATLSNTGALTLASTGVSSGTYPKVTVDGKGRVTGGTSLAAGDMPTGIGRANLSTGTANHVLINDGSGYLSSEAILSVVRGGTGANTLGSGNLLIGAGNGPVTSLAAGVAGNVVYATGATTWASGSPNAAGLVDLASIQTITGAKGFANYIQMSQQNELRFADSDSSNYVALRSPASVAANISWTLPAIDGANGQALATNGAGNLSWLTPILQGGNVGVTTIGTVDLNNLTLKTNNTARVTVLNNGTVGIGTTTPDTAAILHVAGSTSPIQLEATQTQSTNMAGYFENTAVNAGGVGASVVRLAGPNYGIKSTGTIIAASPTVSPPIPTLTGGCSTGTIVGNNNRGLVTFASGSTSSPCQVNFNPTFGTADPNCVIGPASDWGAGTYRYWVSSVTTATLTISTNTTPAIGNAFTYICL
ncbi:MAG: hypothetical protein IPM97_06480 [Bdellovibrionaceae bacterium]|nr:hypothetical protein [Pseudobdellovibrionaceae bacterium]